MSIETKCPGCGRLLRVESHHAGKQARCPMCNTIHIVPAEATSRQSQSSEVSVAWSMKTPEGQVYGPVGQAELEQWLHEGRLTAECQLQRGESGHWQPADDVFGVLRIQSTVSSTTPQSGALQSSVGVSTPPGSHGSQPFSGGFQTPHRGVLILILGILAWIFTCPIFSVLAWVMGSSDLREMRFGRMDESGLGLTQAGRLLGMIYTLLWGAIVAIVMFILILAAMAGSLR